MKYTQRKVLDEWKKLFPIFKVEEDCVNVSFQGKEIKINVTQNSSRQSKSTRNISYR